MPVIPIEAARPSQASPAITKPRWDRAEASAVAADAEKTRGKVSQRQFARDAAVPRSSLRHWEARKAQLDENPEVVAFFESPAGLSVLHGVNLAAHLVLTQIEPAGERAVSLFLRLARLDRFIAASTGKQHQVAMDIQQTIFAFEKQEGPRLAALRPVEKPIVICLDENYHSEVCLIAQEPVSNFLVLEDYAPDCKAETWASRLRQAIEEHRVTLLAGSGDGGSGLTCALVEHLGVPHHAELFHPQHDMTAGTAAPLAARQKRAQEACDMTGAKASALAARLTDTPSLQPLLEAARSLHEQAKERLERATEQREEMSRLIRSIGETYHPVDLQSGVLRSAEQVEQGLNETLAEAKKIATEAKLSEASHERLEKAARAVPSLAARVCWWQAQVKALVGGAGLSSSLQQLMLLVLIPACYLMRASDKARNRAMRQTLDRTAEALLATCRGQAHPWTLATESERAAAMALAWQCADLFQRSSSCVEGRNGYLSLLHHGLRRIPRERLRVLTILHNYFLRRSDGTTAAERFFGHPPADLFEFLLDHVKLPSRPTTRQAAPAADWRAAA